VAFSATDSSLATSNRLCSKFQLGIETVRWLRLAEIVLVQPLCRCINYIDNGIFALAVTDEAEFIEGVVQTFNPGVVVGPLATILDRDVQIATFSNHLSEFCQAKRGEILERTGQERAYRFRFHDPLLVPLVFMEALSTNLVSTDTLSKLLGARF
jgi:hypothetical protein